MLPNLQSLKPDDLRWNWCNNKRNKVHSKCNMLESSQNLSPCCPGAWKNGLLWNRCLVPERWGTTALNRRQCLAHNSSSVKNCWMIWYFCVCVLSPLSHVWCFLTLWTIARQALLSMGFSRQEYWSGLPCPPPGDLPDLGIEPLSLTSPALAGRFFTTSATCDHPNCSLYIHNSLAPLCGCLLSRSVVFNSLQPHIL